MDRVRQLFLPNLVQIKKKFHAHPITTILVETQEDLRHLHEVFGTSFYVSVRCSLKLFDGVLSVKTGSVINVVFPPVPD